MSYQIACFNQDGTLRWVSPSATTEKVTSKAVQRLREQRWVADRHLTLTVIPEGLADALHAEE